MPDRTPNVRDAGRVHYYVAASLDGFIAAPDGSVAWLDPYADALESFPAFSRTVGAAVMGRKTWDQAVTGGYSDFGMPSYVVTHRPLEPGAQAGAYAGDVSALVERIRAEHPRDIWLLGGGELARAFNDADLIDIWTVSIIPTVLGAGLPLLPPGNAPERRLRLVDTQTFPSGVVQLRYERPAASGAPTAANDPNAT